METTERKTITEEMFKEIMENLKKGNAKADLELDSEDYEKIYSNDPYEPDEDYYTGGLGRVYYCIEEIKNEDIQDDFVEGTFLIEQKDDCSISTKKEDIEIDYDECSCYDDNGDELYFTVDQIAEMIPHLNGLDDFYSCAGR